MTDNNIELAWAAGFFDGEGTIGFQIRSNGRSVYRSVKMAINQTDIEPLTRFKDAIQIGSITGPYHRKSTDLGTKDYWVWQTAAIDEVKSGVDKLLLYLCGPKRTQATQAIQMYDSSPTMVWDFDLPE